MADGLAQLVEQRPFKAWVLGSSPRPVTVRKDSRENESLFFWYRRLMEIGRITYPHGYI